MSTDYLNTALKHVAMVDGRVLFLISLLPLYYISRTVFRIFFHPLSRFKGPWKAASTSEWIRKLHWNFPETVLEKLHKDYDTKILRIGPNELHITDPSVYNQLYGRSPQLPKAVDFYDGLLTGPSNGYALPTEPNIHAHQVKRKLMNPLFSKASISSLEPLIRAHIDSLFAKISKISERDDDISLFVMFKCFTMDTISHFAFGESLNMVEQSSESFHAEPLKAFEISSEVLPVCIYSKPVQTLINYIPTSVLMLSAPFRGYVEFIQFCVDTLGSHYKKEKQRDFPVIFDKLTSLPMNERRAEAFSIVAAGTDTTAISLTVAVSHIASNPRIRDKLVQELKDNVTTNSSLVELEQLEYLQCVIKETLRIATPIPGRLPRVVPQSGMTINGEFIPPGTIIGMSAYTMHKDKHIWGEDYAEFRPERWLGPGSQQLETYLVPFSKGPRNCIGLNLASAELIIVLVHLFLTYEITMVKNDLTPLDRFIANFKNADGNVAKFKKLEK